MLIIKADANKQRRFYYPYHCGVVYAVLRSEYCQRTKQSLYACIIATVFIWCYALVYHRYIIGQMGLLIVRPRNP